MMDDKTYIALVPEVRHVVWREATRYLPDADDAADATQEVMLRLWQLRGQLSKDKSQLCAYAAVVCRNLCLNQLKGRKRHRFRGLFAGSRDEEEGPEEAAYLPSTPGPDVEMEAKEAYGLCENAVKQLPEKWQIILRMRSEQHMETEDIARALGTSAGAVRGMLSKARARLLTLINQQYEIRRNQH